MNDFPALKKSPFRYWERRRIVYNLALVPPAFLGYMFAEGINYMGDVPEPRITYVLSFFALSALGANICYSFAYALEFFFRSDDPTSRWLRFGRSTFFIVGVVFAMILALLGGRNIADMEYYYRLHHAV
jgi:hypothetical protein